MTTLKASSKRAQNWINAYWRSNAIRLEDCYKRHSMQKRLAYVLCVKTYGFEQGDRFRIISHNQMQFTCGWIINDSDLRIETRDNSFVIHDIPLPF